MAVSEALQELGFSVVLADSIHAPRDLLHDLEIQDAADDPWKALGEVKGYTKGAKTDALVQFGRFNKRYFERNGVLPDVNWYVVNQFRLRDPSERQGILSGMVDDVAVFASSNGLILDTVLLYRLVMSVRRGDLDDAMVRRRLRESTGIAAWPPAPMTPAW